jgi:hypothetical protein
VVWLFSFSLIFAAIFSYLLFAPFYIEINSANSLFAVRFHHLASLRVVLMDSSLKINLTIAGWKKQIDLLKQISERQRRKTFSTRQKKSHARLHSFGLIRAILKSFSVKKCYLNIDTGDMQLNGILYPLFYWLSKYTGKPIAINFQNQIEIVVEIQNNCARIIMAFICSSLKIKRSWKT